MTTKKKIDFNMFVKEKPEVVTGGLLAGNTASLLPENNDLQTIINQINGDCTIYWTIKGEWNMHQLLVAILNITGTAHVVIATYAMCEMAARTISQLKDGGMILSLSTIVDNRVDVRSAGSFQLMKAMSDRLVLDEVHAKVTVVYNQQFSIAVIGSANYTENNRYECGVITTNLKAVNGMLLWMNKALELCI